MLSSNPVIEESLVYYAADDGKGQAGFTIRFDENTELTGYMKLHLWVESVGLRYGPFRQGPEAQQNGKGSFQPSHCLPNPVARIIVNLLWSFGIQKLSHLFFTGPAGRLRVSHRD